MLGSTAQVGEHAVEQRSFQAGVTAASREAHVGAAAFFPLGTDHEDFAGVAHHARLDAHAHPHLVIGVAHQAADTAAHGRRQVLRALPLGDELTGLRTLLGDAEAVVLEVGTRYRPDFRRRTLRHQPTRVAALLQAELVGLGRGTECLRTRYLEALRRLGAGRHVCRHRQQRIDALGVDIGRHLHRRGLARVQIVGGAVTEVTFVAPQPAAAAGTGDDQGKGGESSQSLHAQVFLD